MRPYRLPRFLSPQAGRCGWPGLDGRCDAQVPTRLTTQSFDIALHPVGGADFDTAIKRPNIIWPATHDPMPGEVATSTDAVECEPRCHLAPLSPHSAALRAGYASRFVCRVARKQRSGIRGSVYRVARFINQC